jgi:oxepin-CoA hydrolase/3-oxo-5,6-dehydrosuberyl-CoA semialdehyde dehydrogenase
VLARVAELRREAELVAGSLDHFEVSGADAGRGAFVPPLLLLARSPASARAIHEVEAFGPVATVMAYRDTEDAIALARRSGGSLAASVFCADDALASRSSLALRHTTAAFWS